MNKIVLGFQPKEIMSDSKKSLTERRSFPREFKLRVISHHRSINNNTYKTAKEFNVSTATVRRWVKNEAIILVSIRKCYIVL